MIDHTGDEAVERTESERDVETYKIPAHRVVIAARCDWFRRALLSGMRESIDRLVIAARCDWFRRALLSGMRESIDRYRI